MENYPSNSIKPKETERAEEKKKLEKVIVGQAKTKKKTGFSKFVDGLVADQAPDIKTYLFKDVVIPTIKKTITDIVDMVLYGGNKRSRTPATKVSYSRYWDEPRTTRTEPRAVGYNYDDIEFDTRGDAEAVLDQLTDLIDSYQIASVGDLKDLAGIPSVYTDMRYGWTNLASAEVVRTRSGGYQIKLPRALPIK